MNDLSDWFTRIIFVHCLKYYQSEIQINKFGINYAVRMPEIVITKDGSHSIYVREMNEYYHSVHGAITESQHVYIEAGLKQIKSRHIRILEMGFGTGLNALLTLAKANDSDISIHYTGIEKYPLEKTITDLLNFESISDPSIKGMLKLIHDSPWNQEITIKPGFILRKLLCDMLEMEEINEFDLVYFDAFATGQAARTLDRRFI